MKDGLTINKFFGFGVTEEEQKFTNQFNADEYDTIVFDDIFVKHWLQSVSYTHLTLPTKA